MYLLTQKASKGDGRGQGSKVDEDDGCQDLSVQSICVVADVVAVTPLDVLHHPTERIAGAGQRVLPGLLGTLLNCTDQRRQ